MRGERLQAMTPTFTATDPMPFGRQCLGWLALGRRGPQSSGYRPSGADLGPQTAVPALAGGFADGA